MLGRGALLMRRLNRAPSRRFLTDLTVASCSLAFALAISLTACGGDGARESSAAVPVPAASSSDANQAFDGPSIAYMGRFLANADGSKSFGWSASTITTRMQGRSAAIGLHLLNSSTAPVYFDVSVDNASPTTLTLDPTQASYKLTVDANTPHTISWTRRTETNYGGPVVFTGITYDGTPLPTAHKKNRFIEFIGDSISNGYGALGTEQHDPNLPLVSCSATSVNESVSVSFTAKTAAALKSDYAVIAFAGRGLVYNQDGTTTGRVPSLWTYVSPPSYAADPVAQPYGFDDYTPDVVVVNLGTNDFTAALDPNGLARTSSCLPEASDFVSSYVQFVGAIQARYASARVILTQGPMIGDFQPAARYNCPAGVQQYTTAKGYIQQVVAQVGGQVTFCDLGIQQSYATGCEYHPSQDEHTKMSEVLTACIQQVAGWQ